MQKTLTKFRLIARAIKGILKGINGRDWVDADKNVFLAKLQHSDSRDWQIGADFFCTADKTSNTSFDRHYVYHPAWAMRKLVQDIGPEKHVDISSTLHFCTMASAILPIDFYDYRPADLHLSQLSSLSIDLNNLPFESLSIQSISCMHTVEHIGLGRYGDTVDPLGDIKAMKELQRVVAVGGSLLFVTPIADTNIIQFNAHRVYKPDLILEIFDELLLKEFYYIPGNSGEPTVMKVDSTMIKGEKYGCGCFWFKREG